MFRIARCQPYYANSKRILRFINTEKFWQWTTTERPQWIRNVKEFIISCTIFGITGTCSLYIIRPSLNLIGIKGSLMEGPNSYRVVSLLVMSPMYAMTLFAVGTLAGRHRFFASMSFKILRRFFPFKAFEKVLCTPAKNKFKN